MMRLNGDSRDFSAILDECIGGITGNSQFLEKITALRPEFLQAGVSYIAAGTLGELYKILPLDTSAENDPAVVGDLIKSDLINLYEYYFVNEKKTSRATYDKLLNSAHEQCPFCGGIGTPRNLDHFLPKAHFPQFSIFPQNLVPSCRDCNMDGKASNFARQAADQVIQPYVDNDRFFTIQWIFAECILDSLKIPISIKYYVKPPGDWEQVHKDRV